MNNGTGSKVSGIFIFLLIMGVFIMAVCPPAGLLMIGVGLAKQFGGGRRHRRQVAKLAAEIRAERLIKERREIILAWKSFG